MATEKLNERERRFAELVAANPDASAGRLYEQAGYEARGASADVNACRLLRRAKVSKYIEDLRWEAGNAPAQSRAATVLSIKEKREYLARVVRTAPGTIDEDSDLCQAYKNTPEVREIKMPDKLKALELDSKLAGEFKDNTLTLEAGDGLLGLIKRIRTRS